MAFSQEKRDQGITNPLIGCNLDFPILVECGSAKQ